MTRLSGLGQVLELAGRQVPQTVQGQMVSWLVKGLSEGLSLKVWHSGRHTAKGLLIILNDSASPVGNNGA